MSQQPRLGSAAPGSVTFGSHTLPMHIIFGGPASISGASPTIRWISLGSLSAPSSSVTQSENDQLPSPSLTVGCAVSSGQSDFSPSAAVRPTPPSSTLVPSQRYETTFPSMSLEAVPSSFTSIASPLN